MLSVLHKRFQFGKELNNFYMRKDNRRKKSTYFRNEFILCLFQFALNIVNNMNNYENKMIHIKMILFWTLYFSPISVCFQTHLSSSHAMKEILLRSDACQEPPVNKTTRSRAGIVRTEWRQWAATDHQWRAATFQLNLPKQTGYLHAVDDWALSARLDHKLQVILGEIF